MRVAVTADIARRINRSTRTLEMRFGIMVSWHAPRALQIDHFPTCAPCAGAAALAEGLRNSTSLHTLHLSVSRAPARENTEGLSPQHAQLLLEAAFRLPHLRSLDLGGFRGCASAAACALSPPGTPHLTHLGLSNWEMTGDAFAKLAPALRGLTALRSLRIRGNFLAEAGAAALSELLGRCAGGTGGCLSVRELDLRDNCLGSDASAARLAACLSRMEGLRWLDLRGKNRFSYASAGAIAAALVARDNGLCL